MEKLGSAITIQSKQIVTPTLTPDSLPGDHVRVVEKAEYKEAARCLAEAFKDDDVAMYLVEAGDVGHWTSERKWDLHVDIFEYLVHAHILKGLVTTIGPNYDCVALWLPPGQNLDDWLTYFRSGLWRLEYGGKLSPEGRRRYSTEFVPLLHQTKHEVLGSQENESWYLVYIGTKPESRGKGYARALIESVTQLCDSESRLCYLESSNAVNPQIYRKLGFKTCKTIHLTRGTKPVDMEIMVRSPACPLR